jgi:hypothetical protein
MNDSKKPGHWKRDCRIFKKEQEEKKSTSGLALIGVQRKIEEIDDSDKWYVDSGTSDHMTNQKEWFVDYKNFYVHLPVRIGDGKHIMAVGKGNINIHTYVNNKWIKGYLENVLYVPDIKVNLFRCVLVAVTPQKLHTSCGHPSKRLHTSCGHSNNNN